jgi:hypothetical protein
MVKITPLQSGTTAALNLNAVNQESKLVNQPQIAHLEGMAGMFPMRAKLFGVVTATAVFGAVQSLASETDSLNCRMFALQMLSRGTTLTKITVEPAGRAILKRANRSNGDPDHAGHNWHWYSVEMQIDVAGAPALIPFSAAKMLWPVRGP